MQLPHNGSFGGQWFWTGWFSACHLLFTESGDVVGKVPKCNKDIRDGDLSYLAIQELFSSDLTKWSLGFPQGSCGHGSGSGTTILYSLLWPRYVIPWENYPAFGYSPKWECQSEYSISKYLHKTLRSFQETRRTRRLGLFRWDQDAALNLKSIPSRQIWNSLIHRTFEPWDHWGPRRCKIRCSRCQVGN